MNNNIITNYYLSFADRLEKTQLPCIYKFATGHDCPGCGMQRAIILLLRGNIIESFKMYPPLIPVLIMFAYLAAHLYFKFKYGAKIIVWMFIINVIIILCNFLYKLLL